MFEVSHLQDGEIGVPDEQRTEDTWSPVAQLTQSRAISNYDPSIDSAETYLLQRAYLDPSALDNISQLELRLILKIALVYGHSIRHPILRQAVVLFCLPIWSDGQSKVEEQRRRTRNALKCRLNGPVKLDEGDLLSVFLVHRHYTISASDGNTTEAKRHAEGFFSLINFLQSAGRSDKHFALQGLWPFLAAQIVGRIHSRQGLVYMDWSCQTQIHTLIKAWEYRTSFQVLQLPFHREGLISVGMYNCLLALRSLYEVKWKREGGDIWDTHSTSCKAGVEAALDAYDQEHVFSSIDAYLALPWWDHWGTPKILAAHVRSLYNYHYCRLLHDAMFPPNESPQVGRESRIVTATRFMECLRRVEMMVNRYVVHPAPRDSFLEVEKEPRNSEGTWWSRVLI
jgi:hypothetical protein